MVRKNFSPQCRHSVIWSICWRFNGSTFLTSSTDHKVSIFPSILTCLREGRVCQYATLLGDRFSIIRISKFHQLIFDVTVYFDP